jgi:Ca2+-binding RTX toxin-like protein
MATSPVWLLLFSQRLTVERETPKRFWTSLLGTPRSMAASAFNLRSFEYAFMPNILARVRYLRKPLLGGEGNDVIYAGPGDDPFLAGDEGPAAGDDVIYGGPGDEMEISGGNGDDVIYGGDGSDYIDEMFMGGANKLYCGKGKDEYLADKKDFVSSSCEKKAKLGRPIVD